MKGRYLPSVIRSWNGILRELEVDYDGESLGGSESRRDTRRRLDFHRRCYRVVLQLVMNDRQRVLSWRRTANGIVPHQPTRRTH